MIFYKIIKKSFPVKFILQIDRTHFVPYPLQHGNWPQGMGRNIREIPWFFVNKLLWQERHSNPIPHRLLFVTWLVISDLSKCRWTRWLWKELHVLTDNDWHFKKLLYNKLSTVIHNIQPFSRITCMSLVNRLLTKNFKWAFIFCKALREITKINKLK